MSKRDALQNTINQMSLVGNVSEDIAKACRKAEIHPDLAKVLMRMHMSQSDLDKRCNELLKHQIEQAKVLDRMADSFGITMTNMQHLYDKMGIETQQVFKPDDEENGE